MWKVSFGSVRFWLVLQRYAFLWFSLCRLTYNWLFSMFGAVVVSTPPKIVSPVQINSPLVNVPLLAWMELSIPPVLVFHGDCATCSGPSFNQCLKSHPDRPVLANGRCLRTCSNKTQFFDPSTSSCQACDSSCSSCSAAGPGHCLACSSSSVILQNGICSSTGCITLGNLGKCLINEHPFGSDQ
jgi:hypothetical protein